MKKVLFLITKSVWGGAQRYVYDLAINLPKDKFEVAVALGGNGPLAAKLKEAGIKVINLPSLQENSDLRKTLFSGVTFSILPELIDLFGKEKPDIIHLNSSKISGLGAIAAHYVQLRDKNYTPKTIFTAHGWAFNEDRNLFSKWVIYTLQWLTSFLCRNTIILSNHDYLQAINMPFSPKKKFVLIPLGVPPNSIKFLTKRDAKKALKDKLPLQGRTAPMLVGTIAELTKNKGLEHLVEAVSKVKFKLLNASSEGSNPKKDGFQCLIIGDGEDREKILKQIEAMGLSSDVHLAGFIPEAAKYLKAFDIFVLPSLKEGLPYTLLETMHAGVPIISTPVGGIRDLIDVNGILVHPKNSNELAEALQGLIQNEDSRKNFAKESLKKTKTKFSFELMLGRTIMLYEQ
ncbi:glycosyltransferase [Candidatus Giovannonibacteria bacterium]|nr:glycosyltransferase [Candidatus Giovannonibacteria bacterium]